MTDITDRTPIRTEYEPEEFDADGDQHGDVTVRDTEFREITASRDLGDVSDAVWAIEATEYEVVRDLWEHIEDDPEFEDWGFRSPYPNGDIDVSLDYTLSIHEVVKFISDRDDVTPQSVYIELMWNSRIYSDDAEWYEAIRRIKPLVQYLAVAEGIDTSDWTHGYSPGGTGGLRRKMPDEWTGEWDEEDGS